jgi:hypothetical protein
MSHKITLLILQILQKHNTTMTEEEIINDIINNFDSLDNDSKKYLLQNSIKCNIVNLCKLQKITCKVTQLKALYRNL